jgi:hypothetical protein
MKSKQHRGLVFVSHDLLGDAAKVMLDEIVASEKLVFCRELTGMADDMLPSMRVSHIPCWTSRGWPTKPRCRLKPTSIAKPTVRRSKRVARA